jgi:hypothetical protein
VDYDDFSGSSLDTSKWGTMNFYGGDKPEVKDGRVEFSSSGKSASASSDFKQGWNSTEFINYTESAPGSVLYVNDSTVYGMEASVTLPVGSSPKTAICLQVGSLNPFGQHIAELMNDSGNGAGFWIHDYVADTGVSTSASSATTFQVAVIHENEKNTFYINSKKVHEFDASNFTPDWFGINTFENDGKAYTVYADNIRVLRLSNTTTEPDPVTVVSDPNGQAVVVQVGNEYQWNSTLDGVTLWVVGKDGNNWSLDGTTKFENGKQLIVFSMVDSINGQQTYSHSYSVDENGYLRVLEDDGDFQYYNPVSVENGVIGMIGNDEGVDSVANNGVNQVDQWFFTTRSAAEEYYYSKVGYPNPKGWLWFDKYPWVYSSEEQGWLYLMPSGGKLMYYSHKSKVWREFNQ